MGYLLYFIYTYIVSNVGIAILIFTLVVKGVQLPLYIKQQKATAKTAVFQPKVAEIQQKYRNNQQKMQDEIWKLQQQGYKPMAGCGTMLLTFLILFGVIDVVYKPLTHIVHMKTENIREMAQEAYDVEVTALFAEELSKTPDEVAALEGEALEKYEAILADAGVIVNYYNQNCLGEGAEPIDVSVFENLNTKSTGIIRAAFKHAVEKAYNDDTVTKKKKQKLISDTVMYKLTDDEQAEMNAIGDADGRAAYQAAHSFSSYTTSALTTAQIHYGAYATDSDGTAFTASNTMQRELYALECFGTVTDKFAYMDAFSESVVRPEVKAELSELHSNLNFAGIPLGQVPKEHFGFPMILIPIIAFLFSFAQSVISTNQMKQSNPETAQAMGPMRATMYIMPFISLWIAFTVPAGAGFYWAITYAFGIGQTLLLNKLYNPAKLRAEAEAELNAKNKTVNVEATKISREEAQNQKEINRRKLAEARKKDAEKYGEEYHEDDGDED